VAEQQARSAKKFSNLGMSVSSRFGYREGPLDLSYLRNTNTALRASSLLGATVSSFASSYDLRSLGRVTSVKNQGAYGTCWAFATFGSMESCLLSSAGETRDFSENNLVNLSGFDWGFDEGGNALMSMAYLLRWNGPVNESSDAYPGVGTSTSLAPVKHVQQVRIIPGKLNATANDAIKQALVDNGAVMGNYYHDDACYNYTYKSYYFSGTSNINHAVTIVGWDDAFSSSKFNNTPAGNGAYIVKNSWGPSWGDSGYYYISYYDSKLAWNETYVFVDASPTNTYKTAYQYDPFGWIGSIGVGKTFWGANMFTASSSERLGAVGFYAVSTNLS
jgi:C1A family cysteine protease